MSDVLDTLCTPDAPEAIGPYSQAVMVDANRSLIFVSGQLPIKPKQSVLIKGDIKACTEQVFDNIDAILHSRGSGLHKAVRLEIFLIDLERDFAEMNQVYAARFTGPHYPARQTVQVAALPKGAIIEMSCVALA